MVCITQQAEIIYKEEGGLIETTPPIAMMTISDTLTKLSMSEVR